MVGLSHIEAPPAPAAAGEFSAAIKKCFERLPEKPRMALQSRMSGLVRRDEALPAGAGMTLNKFVQNIRRARLALAECLRRRGLSVGVPR